VCKQAQSVPVIFEPPCIFEVRGKNFGNLNWIGPAQYIVLWLADLNTGGGAREGEGNSYGDIFEQLSDVCYLKDGCFVWN
jgi:hypothetical protein